jgi:alkylation response protein AidB-like acyl-CoA dehydrogenase
VTIVGQSSDHAETSSSRTWADEPVPSTHEEWMERARRVKQVLVADDADRDRSSKTPYAEIALLKDARLPGLLVPAEHGGGGMEWPTAYQIIREVAAGDGSIGHLLGYHYMWAWVPKLIGTPEQIARFDADLALNQHFCAGAVNARDADVLIRDEGDHLVLNGWKNFSTGMSLSDIAVIEGVIEATDTHVFVIVPTGQPGLIPHDDWDNMGQRLTESGSCTINDVRVPWRDAMGFVNKEFQPRVYGTMTVPIGQLVFANLWLGIARSALAHAMEYTRTHGSAWGGYQRTVDEPRVLDTVGDLTAKLWSAEALVDQVAEEGRLLHRDPQAVTERIRGEHKIRTAAVKARADEVALEITSRIFEVTGARSTATKYGFDRFWRNVRTHTLHDPVAYQRREIGRFELLGEIPEPGWYS